MEKLKFKNIFSFEKKSKIKAGDGLPLLEGQYAFYTSSDRLTKSLNEYLFEGESLIFGTGGHASIHYTSSRFAVSTDCYVCQPLDPIEVDVKYVYHYLNGNIHLLEEGFKGAGLKHISKSYIEDLEIPLPDLATQKKIAALLDKADELHQYNKQLIEKYDALTQSLFLDMFGDPVRNEKGWQVKPLGEILDFLTSGSRGWAKYYSDKGDIFLRIQNVGYNRLKINDLQYITTPKTTEAKRTKVQEGDIIISITADLGRTAVIPNNFPNAYINQHLAILRLRNNYNPVFVSAYIASAGGQKLFKKMDKGGVKAGLNFTDLKSYLIACPAIQLQNQFAERVQLIEQQKEQAQQALQKSEELFNSLLQKAFKGELVPEYEL